MIGMNMSCEYMVLDALEPDVACMVNHLGHESLNDTLRRRTSVQAHAQS